MSSLYIGTSAFTAAGWEGTFYPPGTKPADFLRYYAQHFDTVEVDSTFYRIPSKATVQGWALKTPKGFVFAAKVPQICGDRSYVVLISDRLFSRGLGMRQHHIMSSRRSKPHRAACWRVLQIASRQRSARPKASLQTPKELHQVRIAPPFQSGVRGLDSGVAGGERPRFHCHVGFSIDIGCVHRHVAQPRANRIDVHASAKQVSCRGVPNGVRAHSLLPQGWDLVGRRPENSLHHRVNAETCHGITIAVDEQPSIAGSPVTQWQKRGHRLCSERTESDLSAFAVELHDSSSVSVPLKIFDHHADGLAGPGTGVVQEQQERMIPM